MRKINKKTGEIHPIKVKGLWSHFPIPAYQVLARQREWQAQKVLVCLVSFLGSDGFCVYPSYGTIARTCGIGENGIFKALGVLEENGFIKTFRFREGKKSRNKYFLQESCWDTSKMNATALANRTPRFKCLDCKDVFDGGGYGKGPAGKTHYGCGGPVIQLNLRQVA
jgi:hypothetical protein